MRRLTMPLLALGVLALCAADASAGPIRNWFQSRRGHGACQTCPPTQFIPSSSLNHPLAAPCGPGGCKLPSGPVPSLVVPQVMPAPAGGVKAVGAIGDGRLRERILLAVVHRRAVDQLQKDGFAAIGKDATPLTKAKAEALYNNLTDEMVMGVVREASPQTAAALADGGFLANFLQWIVDHQEQIQAVIKLILTLLLAFA